MHGNYESGATILQSHLRKWEVGYTNNSSRLLRHFPAHLKIFHSAQCCHYRKTSVANIARDVYNENSSSSRLRKSNQIFLRVGNYEDAKERLKYLEKESDVEQLINDPSTFKKTRHRRAHKQLTESSDSEGEIKSKSKPLELPIPPKMKPAIIGDEMLGKSKSRLILNITKRHLMETVNGNSNNHLSDSEINKDDNRTLPKESVNKKKKAFNAPAKQVEYKSFLSESGEFSVGSDDELNNTG